MAELIDKAQLSLQQRVELLEGGKIALIEDKHDPFLPPFSIELDAKAATLLFDFLLLHQERLIRHRDAPGSSTTYQQAKPALAAYVQANPFEPDESGGELDWKAIEKQAEQDLQAITDDASAYRFIEKYFVHDLRGRYLAIYRSDRHEMNRSPRQAIDNLLSLPPLE